MKKLGIIALLAISFNLIGCSKSDDADVNKDAANANVTPPKKLAGAAGMGGGGGTEQPKSQEPATGTSQTSTTP